MTDRSDANKIYGLLGRKISYSLSPVMHNAAFRHFGIPAEYRIFDIEEKELGDFFQKSIFTGGIRGFNVTVPYKVQVRELLDVLPETIAKVDPLVKCTGAVNTIKLGDKGGVQAFNTDVGGFKISLEEDIPDFSWKPRKRIFLIGAGGAGRAIAIYLAFSSFAEKICVYDTDPGKTGSLKRDFEGLQKSRTIQEGVLKTVESAGDIPEHIKGSDLVVNATPLGTKEGDPMPLPPEHLEKGMAVYDLIYARETELVKAAKEKGIPASGGLGMLVNQAALSFNIWTGKPLNGIKKAMRGSLEEKWNT